VWKQQNYFINRCFEVVFLHVVVVVVVFCCLANPGPVAAEFWVDEEELESKYYLDAIITVVDAKHLIQHLDDAKISPDVNVNEAERQLGWLLRARVCWLFYARLSSTTCFIVAFADRILLNKKDLIDDSMLEEIKRRIREINSVSPILITEHCRLPIEQIIGIKAFSAKRVGNNINCCCVYYYYCVKWLFTIENLQNQPENSLPHSKGVRTVSFVEPQAFELAKFESWLGSLLWENDDNDGADIDDDNDNNDEKQQAIDVTTPAVEQQDFFRIKGVLSIKDDDKRYVLQCVHELFDVTPSGAWPDDEPRLTRMVFIGRGLDREKLIKSFKENVLSSD
jgi:G3E family GTPase